MRYLLLIYLEPEHLAPAAEAARTMSGDYRAYTDWLQQEGMLLGGEALQDVASSTTVGVRDGRRIVTDGPFAETKEHLAGYFLVQAPDLDAAIDAAARIPGAELGTIEIRPIRELA